MICTNNPVEGPFATVRAFLHMYPRLANPNPNPNPNPYPSMKLKTVAALSAAIVNGTHRAAHKVGKRTVPAGLAITAAPLLQHAVSTLCGVRRRNPGPHAAPINPYHYTNPYKLPENNFYSNPNRNKIRSSYGLP